MAKKNNLYGKVEHISNSKFKKTTVGGKTNRYKTANQRALFDTLLLGSLNRGDLKRIEKLEKDIQNVDGCKEERKDSK